MGNNIKKKKIDEFIIRIMLWKISSSSTHNKSKLASRLDFGCHLETVTNECENTI